MNYIMIILMLCQLIFMVIAGIYFFENLNGQKNNRAGAIGDSQKETERLAFLRSIHLTEPLSEKTRPKTLDEVVGQEDGIKALRAVLCGENPQHILIYGPPGVGKTAAARLVLEEAKKSSLSPFKADARFIEIDATTLRFDERSIADPLIGSVHDPIYQGAGAFGQCGIPQIKEGAVTKAHGGVLFIDEIGELHSLQMNKLLKVLEDRKVFMTSSYYSSSNKNIPAYIHDMFENGLPADFRLIGATTRSPQDIPAALRSRCCEIYFDALNDEQLKKIGMQAVKRTGLRCTEGIIDKIVKYSQNGRDTVNMLQTAASVCGMERRKEIRDEDVEWVAQSGRYIPKMETRLKNEERAGIVNGLAVFGNNLGTVLEIEVSALKAMSLGKGSFKVTGIAEKEEIQSGHSVITRNSSAKASVENVMTVMKNMVLGSICDYDIHINFPGGIPVDGPSAGIAIFCGVYSVVTGLRVRDKLAMTGEISVMGKVLPVGGVKEKICAALAAGAETVIVPSLNRQKQFDSMRIEIIYADNIEDVLKAAFKTQMIIPADKTLGGDGHRADVLTAKGI